MDEWTRLCREQRAAYFAWQRARPGEEFAAALAAYRAACKAQDDYQAQHGKGR